MTDPYKILGINYGASEQELRDAYKRCARMYANDYGKMEEIDRAYDEIIAQKNGGGNSYGYSYGYGENDIRSNINTGNTIEAQRLLDMVNSSDRDGEWFFLQGLVHQKKGRLNKALECFERALNFDPTNPEYQNAYEAMNQSRNGGYRQTHGKDDKNECCNICSGLLCADCCCECMGGDLIPCC